MSERSKILKINDNISAHGSVTNIKNISNDRFSRLPPNIKDSIRRILLKRDLTRSQQKPLLYPNVKEYDLSDCSLPHDDLLIVSDILRNPLNGLLSLFMASVVAKKILPEPEYFLIGKPCSSLPSGRLPTKRDVLKLIIWERDRYEKEKLCLEHIDSMISDNISNKMSLVKPVLLWVGDNITTLSDRQLLNNMPGMCGSWSDKDRMRLGAKLEEVVHHVKVQQMDASVFSEEVEVASDQSFLFSLHSIFGTKFSVPHKLDDFLLFLHLVSCSIK